MEKYQVSLEDLKQITTREELPALLNKMNAETVVEVGVQMGGYLHILLTSNIKTVYAVDCWKETGNVAQNDSSYTQDQLDAQYYVCRDWAKYIPRIKVVREFSVEAASHFEDGSQDVVYLDADHSEKAVWDDLTAWWPKVRSGGILAGHDYSPAIVNIKGTVLKFGVIEAVNKFSAYKKVPFHADGNMSFYFVKP